MPEDNECPNCPPLTRRPREGVAVRVHIPESTGPMPEGHIMAPMPERLRTHRAAPDVLKGMAEFAQRAQADDSAPNNNHITRHPAEGVEVRAHTPESIPDTHIMANVPTRLRHHRVAPEVLEGIQYFAHRMEFDMPVQSGLTDRAIRSPKGESRPGLSGPHFLGSTRIEGGPLGGSTLDQLGIMLQDTGQPDEEEDKDEGLEIPKDLVERFKNTIKEVEDDSSDTDGGVVGRIEVERGNKGIAPGDAPEADPEEEAKLEPTGENPCEVSEFRRRIEKEVVKNLSLWEGEIGRWKDYVPGESDGRGLDLEAAAIQTQLKAKCEELLPDVDKAIDVQFDNFEAVRLPSKFEQALQSHGLPAAWGEAFLSPFIDGISCPPKCKRKVEVESDSYATVGFPASRCSVLPVGEPKQEQAQNSSGDPQYEIDENGDPVPKTIGVQEWKMVIDVHVTVYIRYALLLKIVCEPK